MFYLICMQFFHGRSGYNQGLEVTALKQSEIGF